MFEIERWKLFSVLPNRLEDSMLSGVSVSERDKVTRNSVEVFKCSPGTPYSPSKLHFL